MCEQAWRSAHQGGTEMADVAEKEWRGRPIWLIVVIFIAELVNTEDRQVANYSAVPRISSLLSS